MDILRARSRELDFTYSFSFVAPLINLNSSLEKLTMARLTHLSTSTASPIGSLESVMTNSTLIRCDSISSPPNTSSLPIDNIPQKGIGGKPERCHDWTPAQTQVTSSIYDFINTETKNCLQLYSYSNHYIEIILVAIEFATSS